jgi:hypothetical protein
LEGHLRQHGRFKNPLHGDLPLRRVGFRSHPASGADLKSLASILRRTVGMFK